MKEEEDEEMKMIQQAIEMSKKEEEERAQVQKVAEEESEKKEDPQSVETAVTVKAVEEKPLPVVSAPAKVDPVESVPLEKRPIVEVTGRPAMSEAELKKLEQLKALKKQGKLKKAEEKKVDDPLPKINSMALPPVMMQRRGQFDMVPDFLNKKELLKDQTSLNEMDMMQEALNKQATQDEGKESFSELLKRKRTQTEKAIEEQKSTGKPGQQDMEDRKARLMAQRDLLRKQKEDKRQAQL